MENSCYNYFSMLKVIGVSDEYLSEFLKCSFFLIGNFSSFAPLSLWRVSRNFKAVASLARTPPSAQIPCACEWEINFWHAMKNLEPSLAETVQFSISSLIKTDINELRQQLNTISLCKQLGRRTHYMREGVARKRVKHGHLSLTTNNRAESERSFYIVITVLADWLQMRAPQIILIPPSSSAAMLHPAACTVDSKAREKSWARARFLFVRTPSS